MGLTGPMSCYRRIRVPGATVFFTVALEARGSTLLTEEIARLRLAFARTRAERPFTLDACVVLPDHLHCVWTLPPGDDEYSTRWGAIKSRFSRLLRDDCRAGFNPALGLHLGKGVGWNPTLRRSASKVEKGETGLWQRRFWEHHIRDEADYDAHLRYCWHNPVKHGLVASPHDWPFSSIHRDVARGMVA